MIRSDTAHAMYSNMNLVVCGRLHCVVDINTSTRESGQTVT